MEEGNVSESSIAVHQSTCRHSTEESDLQQRYVTTSNFVN